MKYFISLIFLLQIGCITVDSNKLMNRSHNFCKKVFENADIRLTRESTQIAYVNCASETYKSESALNGDAFIAMGLAAIGFAIGFPFFH